MDEDLVFPLLFLAAPVLVLGSTLIALLIAVRRQRQRARYASFMRRRAVDLRFDAEAARRRILERSSALTTLAQAYERHQDLIDEFLEAARRSLPKRDELGREFWEALPTVILALLVEIGAREGLSPGQVEGVFGGLRRPARGDPAFIADAAKRRLIEDLARHLDSDVRLMHEEQTRVPPTDSSA